MADYTELKRVAEAANAVTGDVSVDIAISSERGPNQSEIDAVAAFVGAATPAAVLALIAENERLLKLLERTVEQHVPLTELEGVPGWSRVVELVEVVTERDQLRAEVAGLRTGYEAYERVNAELKAEVEALRHEREGKVLCDLELFETLRDSANTEADEHRQCMATYRPLRQASLDSVVKKCDDLLAALGQGEQS